MQSFAFTPVDTPYGQFRLGVDFQPASTVTILEQTTSPPPLPQIIADYVGSPRGGTAAPAGAGAAGHPPLRHAMSSSLFAGGGGAAASAGAPSAGLTSASPPGMCHTQRLSSTPPVRRSWSTAMRGLSPNRLGPVQGCESASPRFPYGGTATAAAPSGSSAPQQGAVFGPAVLRSLSGPGRAAPGSPSAKPPLSRPPRARGCSEAELPCHGDASPAGPSSQAGVPTSYQPSAPVLIPGPQARRLRSSGDLWAMQQAANMQKPLSAPAVTHMRRGTPDGGGGSGDTQLAGAGGEGSLPREPSLPPTPLPVIPGTVESESSGSAASSHMFPTSCSPQLPFAFTPSGQLGISSGRSAAGPLGESLRLERTSPQQHRSSGALCSAGGAAAPGAAQQHGSAGVFGRAGFSPAGLTCTSGGTASSASGGSTRASPRAGINAGEVAGREVSASLALARRPSWFAGLRASQSGCTTEMGGALVLNGVGGAALSVVGVGYSVSPMADPTLEAMLAGSTPRRYSGALMLHVGSGGDAAAAGSGAPALMPAGCAGGASGLGLAGTEPDALPFALDADSASLGKTISPALPESASHRLSPSVAAQPASTPAEAEQLSSDAAVGAFVRLLQDAPRALRVDSVAAPIAPYVEAAEPALLFQEYATIPALTLQTGLERLSLMRERLAERGVSLPPGVQVP